MEPEYVDIDENEGEVVVHGTHTGETEITVPKKLEGLAFMSPDDIPDLSDETVTVGMSLSPQYYEGFIKPGDKVRAIYNGMTVIHSLKNVRPGEPAKEIETVVFQNRDGVFLHSGANLVSQLRGYPSGKAIQIEYLGQERTGAGNQINKFDVRVLNISPF